MSEDPYFTEYQSPNIEIVPTMSFCNNPPSKPESGSAEESSSTSKSIPILIHGNTSSNSMPHTTNSYCNKSAKNKSWASNYLQSIGLPCNKTNFKHKKMKMNITQVNSNFFTQDSIVTTIPNTNIPNPMPTENYNGVYNPTSGITENTTFFPNYNNMAPTMETNATMPPSNPYVGENRGYYIGEPMNLVENSGSTMPYYNANTASAMVNFKMPTTYPAYFGQSMNVENNTYYNPIGASNLPYLNTYLNQMPHLSTDYNQPINVNENTTSTAGLCDTNKTDSNISASTPTILNGNADIIKKSTITINLLKEGNSCNVDKNIQNNEVERCCNCLCSKSKPDVNVDYNNKTSTEIDSEGKHVSLKPVCHQEHVHKEVNSKKTNKDTMLADLSSTYSGNGNKNDKEHTLKAEKYPRFIKTKYVDEQEPEYKPIKKARINRDHETTKNEINDLKSVDRPRSSYDIAKSKSYFEVKQSKNIINSPERLSKREKSSYKNDKTEKILTKHDRSEENKRSKTPTVKSVVDTSKKQELKEPVIKNSRDTKKSSHYSIPRNEDLRDILTKRLHRKDKKIYRKSREHEVTHKRKTPEKLIITVNNNIGEGPSGQQSAKGSTEKTKQDIKEKTKEKKKRNENNSSKKINLVINIVYQQPSSTSDSDKSESDDQSQQGNVDLSFLDDFNVDEIVASLNKSDKIVTQKTTISEEPNAEIPVGRSSTNKTDSNDVITSMDNSAKTVADGEVLKNLLLKEATLLDSLRLVHKEIENEKLSINADITNEVKLEFEHGEDKLSGRENPVSDCMFDLVDMKVVKEYTNKVADNTIASIETHSNLIESKIQRSTPINVLENIVKLGRNLISNNLCNATEVNLSNEVPSNTIESETRSPITLDHGDINCHKKNVTEVALDGNTSNRSIELIQTTKIIDETTVIEILTDSNDSTQLKNNDLEDNPHTKENIDDVCIFSPQPVKEVEAMIDLTVEDNSNNSIYETSSTKESKPKDTDAFFGTKGKENTLFGKQSTTAMEVDDIVLVSESVRNDVLQLVDSEVISKTEELESNQFEEAEIEVNELETHTTTTEQIAEKIKEDANKEELAIATNISSEEVENIQASVPQISCDNNSLSKNDISQTPQIPNVSKINTPSENNEEKDNSCNKMDIANTVAVEESSSGKTVLPQGKICSKPDISSSNDIKSNDIEPKTKDTQITVKDTVMITSESIHNTSAVIPNTKTEENLQKNTKKTETNPIKSNESKKDHDAIENKPFGIIKVFPSTSGTNTNKSTPVDGKEVPTKIISGQIARISYNLEHKISFIFNQKYSVVEMVHSGYYAKIFRCRNETTNCDYAVKAFNSIKSWKQKETFTTLALQRGSPSDHYRTISIIRTFTLKGHLCYLMDYYPKNLGQALAENKKPFHINTVQHLARQLVSALMLLKSNNVVHFDITPRHILLNRTNNKLKLIGFDNAREINELPYNPSTGTLNYSPPESIVGYRLGFEVDVFATAVVLYEMATLIMLFPGFEPNDILFKQMCTLGALPSHMIRGSHYGHHYFIGSHFKRVVPIKGDVNKINIRKHFGGSDRIERTITNAYNANRNSRSSKHNAGEYKINMFIDLLNNMLHVDPMERMPVQFVNGHPFITDEYY